MRIKCPTVVEKEEPMRASVMMARPRMEEVRRKEGKLWRARKQNGAPRYIIPLAEVPMMGMREAEAENSERVE